MQKKYLPLTHANQFLKSMVSSMGIVGHFDHPNLTLYYTLARKGEPVSGTNQVESVLFVTIVNNKEYTTRVYVRDGGVDRFYSTESNIPLINHGHGSLEVKLGEEIHSTDDVIAGDADIQYLLRSHHQSIIHQIHLTIDQIGEVTNILNPWSMKAADLTMRSII